MEAWRQKVEKVGNQNYPKESSAQGLYGQLRLTTSIRSDGTLEKVEIDKSSGHKVLDEHALSIVKKAAPYAPFSKSMRKEMDVLGIVRTWTYEKD